MSRMASDPTGAVSCTTRSPTLSRSARICSLGPVAVLRVSRCEPSHTSLGKQSNTGNKKEDTEPTRTNTRKVDNVRGTVLGRELAQRHVHHCHCCSVWVVMQLLGRKYLLEWTINSVTMDNHTNNVKFHFKNLFSALRAANQTIQRSQTLLDRT